MSAQYYFTKKDPLGGKSNLSKNSCNHQVYHDRLDPFGYSWGTDKHFKNLNPRGKTYGRLWHKQFLANN